MQPNLDIPADEMLPFVRLSTKKPALDLDAAEALVRTATPTLFSEEGGRWRRSNGMVAQPIQSYEDVQSEVDRLLLETHVGMSAGTHALV